MHTYRLSLQRELSIIKVMSRNLLNRYVWLVETIYKAKGITFAELNRKWLDSEISEGIGLPVRTFHKWRVAIEELFGLNIECDCRSGYQYYISDIDEIKDWDVRRWLLNSISISNLLMDNRHLKDRILLENVPSGQEYLSEIIDAMKKRLCVQITYRSFGRDKSSTFEVEPYCVKLFKQRWYLVARNPYYDQIRIYSLDRIHHLETLTDQPFEMSAAFSPSGYFQEYYGVTVDHTHEVGTVRLKVSATQANYFRSLPLHHSQQEVETADDYSIFQLHIRPTYDFLQEILRNGESVEVLEPQWFREEIAGMVKRMCDKYKN